MYPTGKAAVFNGWLSKHDLKATRTRLKRFLNKIETREEQYNVCSQCQFFDSSFDDTVDNCSRKDGWCIKIGKSVWKADDASNCKYYFD